MKSSDQGLRFLFHEVTAPTLRGGLNWEESCDKNVGNRRRASASRGGSASGACRIPPTRRSRALGRSRGRSRACRGRHESAHRSRGRAGAAKKQGTAAARAGGRSEPRAGEPLALPRPDRGLNVGTVTLGERLGDGALKDVYAIEGRPGLTLQIVHHLKDAAPAVGREIKGYDLIKGDIATPTVHAYRGAAGGLSYMIKDRLPTDAFVTELKPELLAGIGETQGKLVGANRVWVDGHLKNHYIAGGTPGRPVIGIHDTDIVTLADDPAIAPEMSRLLRCSRKRRLSGCRNCARSRRTRGPGRSTGPPSCGRPGACAITPATVLRIDAGDGTPRLSLTLSLAKTGSAALDGRPGFSDGLREVRLVQGPIKPSDCQRCRPDKSAGERRIAGKREERAGRREGKTGRC